MWVQCSLRDIAVLNYGKALKTEDRNLGNIPVFSSAGLSGFHDKPLVDSKGIIVGRKGTIGKIYKTEVPFCCIDTAYYILPDDNKYDFYFLYYLLHTLGFEELNEDSAVPGLNRNTAYDQTILLPPISEQRRIAGILTNVDDKINLLYHQNNTIEKVAFAIFNQTFRKINNQFEVDNNIGDEFDFTMGQSPEGDSLNENGDGLLFFQGNADFGFRFPTPRVYSTRPTRVARPFDTLISVRAPVGSMNMALQECCIGRGVAAFRHKKNPTFSSYTYYKLHSLISQIKVFDDSGTVFGSIGKDDFYKIKNVIPPPELVDEFQNKVVPLDKKIYTNSLQIKALTSLRKTLLPKLISGEIKIKS